MWGIILWTTIGLIKGDTRSSDYSSHGVVRSLGERFLEVRVLALRCN